MHRRNIRGRSFKRPLGNAEAALEVDEVVAEALECGVVLLSVTVGFGVLAQEIDLGRKCAKEVL